jgi:hypothetical protein
MCVPYSQCLAGATGGDLGAVVGEAGRVDGSLVGLDHQTRQALQTTFVPETNHKHKLLREREHEGMLEEAEHQAMRVKLKSYGHRVG